MVQTLDKLLSDPKWKAYEELIKEEVEKSKRQALESIAKDNPNKEAYYRAKFLEEALSIPISRIQASKMNTGKTPLNG